MADRDFPAGSASGFVDPAPSLDELAKRAGLTVYDTALPLAWYEEVHTKTGVWPQSLGFVWSYDSAKIWGEPVALTDEAKALAATLARMASGECAIVKKDPTKPWITHCLTHDTAATMDHHFDVHPDAYND